MLWLNDKSGSGYIEHSMFQQEEKRTCIPILRRINSV